MTAEAGQLQREIAQAQNSDGGWGYHPGSSWTEPTALAVLALQALGNNTDACARGCVWLDRYQRHDGGWAPHPALDTSTSVTSWALLALSRTEVAQPKLDRAAHWLLSQINGELSTFQQLLSRCLGIPAPKAAGGSPWFPGTAAWIAPTVGSILALSQTARTTLPQLAHTLNTAVTGAQQYILARKCRDGGWNHGGSPYRSEDAESYPEMTGMALLALHGAPAQQLEPPLRRAEYFLAIPQSAEALSWLQLGLMRHGRAVPATSAVQCRTLRDACLRLLALAGPGPSNKLFSPPLA